MGLIRHWTRLQYILYVNIIILSHYENQFITLWYYFPNALFKILIFFLNIMTLISQCICFVFIFLHDFFKYEYFNLVILLFLLYIYLFWAHLLACRLYIVLLISTVLVSYLFFMRHKNTVIYRKGNLTMFFSRCGSGLLYTVVALIYCLIWAVRYNFHLKHKFNVSRLQTKWTYKVACLIDIKQNTIKIWHFLDR